MVLCKPSFAEKRPLKRSPMECHVLHFVGHGMDGALVLETPGGEPLWVDDERLGTFFSHPDLRLVVLNACQGARSGRFDPSAGVAQTLVRRGVPAVIAMQCDVSDDVAVGFARHFYHALAEGLPVEGAMSRARLAIFASFEGPVWAIPVLYMNAREGQIWGKQKLSLLAKVLSAAAVVAALSGAGTLLFQSVESKNPPEIRSGDVPEHPPRDSSSNYPDCPSPSGLDMAFVRIEPGSFEMGESKGDKSDEPVHHVEISRPFCLGIFEVTYEQLDRVLGGGNEISPAERNLPARGLTFKATQDIIRRLNDKEPSHPYRLPTEAEWEYAARARSATTYSFGDAPRILRRYGNCKGGDRFDGLAPVGSFLPNDFGLYDMYGNVFEWVSDRYGPYSGEPVKDPRGPAEGMRRIRRGGSWDSSARACSSAARSDVEPDRSNKDTGLRIVREIR